METLRGRDPQLDAESLLLFAQHTGHATPPAKQARAAYVIAGRRGGKSRLAAAVAVYVACFLDHRESLAAGEHGVVMILAVDPRSGRHRVRLRRGVGGRHSRESRGVRS